MDMQVDFSDKGDDKSEPSFGVLSNTTFHPFLAYQPHLYSHGLNIGEHEPIIEDIGSGLVADSVMEDPRAEFREGVVSVAATRTLQPFYWGPPPPLAPFMQSLLVLHSPTRR
jgi:hypothetical protein